MIYDVCEPNKIYLRKQKNMKKNIYRYKKKKNNDE
jgi:hypothetical protein